MTSGFAVTAGWDRPVAGPSHVHAAVAMADAAASHAGLTAADRAGCALIATELATNLARHARDGRLVATATESGPAAWVQLAAVDHGPGIPDVGAAMADGYSTYAPASSLGGGLGACRRAAAVFDLWTSSGSGGTAGLGRFAATTAPGTVVIARIGPGARSGPAAHSGPTAHSSIASPFSPIPSSNLTDPFSPSDLSDRISHIRIGGILAARPGEQESGDAWGVTWDAGTITLVIMDGLGHGPEAAKAAANGLHEVTGAPPADDPATLLGRLDRRLLGGRGAVAAVARLNRDRLTFGGVGNIGARLGRGGDSRGLVSSMGTLGLGQRLRPQASVTRWDANSVFTAHSDGIRPSWNLSRYPGVTGHDPAVMAALIWRDAASRTDDAAVVIAASQPAASQPAASQPAPGPAGDRS